MENFFVVGSAVAWYNEEGYFNIFPLVFGDVSNDGGAGSKPPF